MKVRKLPVSHTDASGKKHKGLTAKFYAVFVDHKGILRRLPLMEDRRASESLARTIDSMNSLRSSGDVLPPDLARAVESMPGAMVNRLAAWDIIPAAKVAAGKPLAEHLADWNAALTAKGGTAKHAERSANRVQRIFAGCGFIYPSDVSASKTQQFIADLRQDRRDAKGQVHRGISPTTFNHYLTAASGFFSWMVKDRRCRDNPLAHLSRVNTKADKRHSRRAMSVDELHWLLDTTTAGIERHGMTGATRSMLYRLAVETGLRASELRSLTRGSFQLDGDEPTVTIAAAYAKNKRDDTLPLRPDTAAALAVHLEGKMPAAKAFNVPPSDKVIDMFRADLADARTAWLESHQSNAERLKAEDTAFLSYVDEAGRFADFHGLRHTFISNLASGGVHPKVAQQLARHSTITLTMDRYTHLRRDDLAAALDTLPDLSGPVRQVAKATGTDDVKTLLTVLSPSLSPNGAIQRNSAQSGAMNVVNGEDTGFIENTGKNAVFPGEMMNGSGGNRTHNRGIMSPLL